LFPLCARYVFQGVHMLMQMTCSTEGDVRPWGPDEKRINRIVFIGRNLDREQLNRSFEACLVKPTLPVTQAPLTNTSVKVQA